jgi:hypothetical protein
VLDVVALRELGELLFIATDEQRLDLHAPTVGEKYATLVANREDRAHKVLPVAHAPGSAIHDDANGRL